MHNATAIMTDATAIMTDWSVHQRPNTPCIRMLIEAS